MIGQSLGPYRVLELVGAGGMATVYLAEDTRHHRRVAIKVLSSDVAATIGVDRFLREIETTARLTHPHIVPLHDSGTTPALPYYVMPYIAGESLRARLQREGPLPVADALHIAREVADALAYAHAEGIVHRDLKPDNVLITAGHALVADFGIAQALADAGGESLTKTGMMLGTPAYMSPEQACGGEVDGRSDIYALGCLLYEMLGGQPPFAGKDSRIVITQHLTTRPTPITDLRPAISSAIVEVLDRALAKAPADRFPSAADFGRALRSRQAEAVEDPAPRVSHVPHNLQEQITSFVGRAVETDECRKLLTENRLLTLTGVGGCGKTRLALRVAAAAMAEYPSGVWFVDLAPIEDSARVVETVANVLGVREEPGQPLLETMTHAVHGKSLLLLLDNCEHLLGACSEMTSALLLRCRRVKVLATSREGLAVAGEQIYRVPSLSFPKAENGADVALPQSYEAVRLFSERAKSVSPQFVLEDNARAVGEICRRLDGIPLAIELAAARVRVISVEQIRVKLEDRFRLLTEGGRAALPRHQTLRATLQWSHDLLSDREKKLFAELAVFAGGWTFESACAVCALDEFEVLDLLSHLVDKSLVAVESLKDGERRYRFLDSVRQFAVEQLEARADALRIRSSHLSHFLALAERAAEKLEGADQAEWLGAIEQEHENLLSAVTWSTRIEQGDEKALRLAGSIWRYWNIRGEYRLGRKVLEDVLTRPANQERTAARAHALYGAAGLAVYQGDYDSARSRFEESLAISRELDDGRCIARALNGLGFLAIEQNDYAAGREFFEASLATHRQASNQRGMAIAIGNLGILSARLGDFAAAKGYHERSIGYLRESGDPHTLALALSTLSTVAVRSGDTANTRVYLRESLGLVRGLSSRRPAAHVLEACAELAWSERDGHRATRLYGAASALREKIGMPADRHDEKTLNLRIEEIRGALGDQAFASEWQTGRSRPLAASLAEASAWIDSPPEPLEPRS